MKTLTVEEATQGLGRLVELALAGEQIQIRKGSGVVELRPAQARFDCLIAGTAIIAQAEVATINQSDFQLFAPHGLKLAIIPPILAQSAASQAKHLAS